MLIYNSFTKIIICCIIIVVQDGGKWYDRRVIKEYKQKLSSLSKEELIERNQYLKDLRSGKIQGPLTGFASIDKPWCNYYSKEQLSEDMPKKTAYDYMFVNNVYHSKEIAINYFGNKTT